MSPVGLLVAVLQAALVSNVLAGGYSVWQLLYGGTDSALKAHKAELQMIRQLEKRANELSRGLQDDLTFAQDGGPAANVPRIQVSSPLTKHTLWICKNESQDPNVPFSDLCLFLKLTLDRQPVDDRLLRAYIEADGSFKRAGLDDKGCIFANLLARVKGAIGEAKCKHKNNHIVKQPMGL